MSQFFASEVSKFWCFTFNISPSNEFSGLISFRMDWLDLLAVQGTLKSLLQHHSSKAPILWHSAFFIVQLSHLYSIWEISILRQIMFSIVFKHLSAHIFTMQQWLFRQLCFTPFLPPHPKLYTQRLMGIMKEQIICPSWPTFWIFLLWQNPSWREGAQLISLGVPVI